ncbi:MAG: flagellar hook-basal body complex protein FliE [Pseudobutyrivibrio sp.]|nr:flagellar hook-basal body complex protein FliE [Pseudobutyrivibrio sp.]
MYETTPVTGVVEKVDGTTGFQSMLDSVMKLMEDTNTLQKNANREQVAFALGETDNTHDLMIAEKKAGIALQYTVAVRDRILESYQQIMQMQI